MDSFAGEALIDRLAIDSHHCSGVISTCGGVRLMIIVALASVTSAIGQHNDLLLHQTRGVRALCLSGVISL